MYMRYWPQVIINLKLLVTIMIPKLCLNSKQTKHIISIKVFIQAY